MSTTLAWYREGGPLMNVVLLVGVIGLGILVERFYVIVLRSKNNGRRFIERVIQLVRAGKVDEAIKECAGSRAVLPDMGLVILRSRSRDEVDLQNVASAAALSLSPRLTRRLQYLPSLAYVGVLVGFFALVIGLQTALTRAANGPFRAEVVAAGLASALGPLALALIVALILGIGRAYLVSQSESIIEQIEEFSARLINALIDRPDVRLGHR
jgi:biopolymer transport protein ExbB